MEWRRGGVGWAQRNEQAFFFGVLSFCLIFLYFFRLAWVFVGLGVGLGVGYWDFGL